ncbi:phospholipase D-like domain-containing protein [Streptomyces sp. NPDC053474]|uniref:phospholipase D-like domain-containing protein n=1 Tax=Streptomyces sp. NPDC053474 TaxID=3365704 RepID=UPI0037CE1A6D
MAGVLESLKPLVTLLGQAENPADVCRQLSSAADTEPGHVLIKRLAASVVDKPLASGVLCHAGVVDESSRLLPTAVVRLAQAEALVEALCENQCDLVVTVPAFLRSALSELVSERPAVHRPRETSETLVGLAREAKKRLVIAAPFLHRDLMGSLLPHVRRLLASGGDVLLITRALTSPGGRQSRANLEAVQVLTKGTMRHRERLTIRSWEEPTLGIHCKVMIADGRVAYLGSANMTVHGTSAHAEVGVLLKGPQVSVLSLWLDQISGVLEERSARLTTEGRNPCGAGAQPREHH